MMLCGLPLHWSKELLQMLYLKKQVIPVHAIPPV
jgi:hypothetical protein